MKQRSRHRTRPKKSPSDNDIVALENQTLHCTYRSCGTVDRLQSHAYACSHHVQVRMRILGTTISKATPTVAQRDDDLAVASPDPQSKKTKQKYRTHAEAHTSTCASTSPYTPQDSTPCRCVLPCICNTNLAPYPHRQIGTVLDTPRSSLSPDV